jgi:diguanylate cyclase (GGDEF)-like protein
MLSDAAGVARVRVYLLMEASQTGDHEAAYDELTAMAEHADRQGWPEVSFLATAGLAQYALLHSPDRTTVESALENLVPRAEALDRPALVALALALRALGAAIREDGGALLADAGRAVALVDDDDLPALDRCTALVICAAAYNTLSLWELCDDLYERASVLAPACEQPVQEPAVVVNRVLIRVEWASALFEIGEEPNALDQARRALSAVRAAEETEGVPPLWLMGAQACGDVLGFVLDAFDEPRLPHLERLSVVDHLARLAERRRALIAAHDVEVLPLMDGLLGLGLLRKGLRSEALATVHLLSEPGSSSSGARTFPSWVRAQILTAADPEPAVAAHIEYGRLVAGLRWRSRQGVLAAAQSAIAAELMGVEHARLSRDVLLDPLTGLSNRRCFDGWLARGSSEERSAAVLLLDLDDFKTVNDVHGHAVGDEALRRVGLLVSQHVRPGDMALRLGGDEFAVVLEHDELEPSTLRRTAIDRARALREAVDRTDWARVAPGLRITVSVGVATAKLGPEAPGGADALYRAADADLYVDKAAHAVGA